MNKFILVVLLTCLASSCQNKKSYSLSDYHVDYSGLLDTILPFFAGLQGDFPKSERFRPEHKPYMQSHKTERQYEWMHYAEKNGYSYFMVSRLEPSMNRDKFLAICGRFRRNETGRVDSASYEELFWTWKMKKDSLQEKSLVLFNAAVEQRDLSPYMPENSDGYWMEFPSKLVFYDKATQSWKTRPSN